MKIDEKFHGNRPATEWHSFCKKGRKPSISKREKLSYQWFPEWVTQVLQTVSFCGDSGTSQTSLARDDHEGGRRACQQDAGTSLL
jgi:hypothetical protein